MGSCELICACVQVVTCADAEDAIELVQLSLFAGSPEEAAVRDFRPAGSRRTGKQARGILHSSGCPTHQHCHMLDLQLYIFSRPDYVSWGVPNLWRCIVIYPPAVCALIDDSVQQQLKTARAL